MTEIEASKFKTQCIALLDDLGPEGLIVTKHGRPIARVLPIQNESEDLIGTLSEKIEVRGDIESTGFVWASTTES